MEDNRLPSRRFRIDRYFRWRGTNVSRIEGFSDAVFALVMALLFLGSVQLTSFAELDAALKSLVPFAATFALLVMIWLDHYLIFRRYDLRDGIATALNFLLLFVVLGYSRSSGQEKRGQEKREEQRMGTHHWYLQAKATP